MEDGWNFYVFVWEWIHNDANTICRYFNVTDNICSTL